MILLPIRKEDRNKEPHAYRKLANPKESQSLLSHLRKKDKDTPKPKTWGKVIRIMAITFPPIYPHTKGGNKPSIPNRTKRSILIALPLSRMNLDSNIDKGVATKAMRPLQRSW